MRFGILAAVLLGMAAASQAPVAAAYDPLYVDTEWYVTVCVHNTAVCVVQDDTRWYLCVTLQGEATCVDVFGELCAGTGACLGHKEFCLRTGVGEDICIGPLNLICVMYGLCVPDPPTCALTCRSSPLPAGG